MRKMLMKNIIFKYISIILVSVALFGCQTEEDKKKETLEEHMAGMNPEDRAEFQEVSEEYKKTAKDIDKSAPIHLTMDLQSAFDKIYCKGTGLGGWIPSLGSSNLATCSEGRIAVCGTQGDSTEVKPYCVIHDAEAGKYYRVTSETPDDHCEDGKKVVCNE